MQYTYATSAYHEARFLVHFHLAIWANFERGVPDILILHNPNIHKVSFSFSSPLYNPS